MIPNLLGIRYGIKVRMEAIGPTANRRFEGTIGVFLSSSSHINTIRILEIPHWDGPFLTNTAPIGVEVSFSKDDWDAIAIETPEFDEQENEL